MNTAASSTDKRVRNSALALGLLALAFYLGFIALLVYRSQH
jgi:hypothetical protein